MPHKGYRQTAEHIIKRANAWRGRTRKVRKGWIHQGVRVVIYKGREMLEHRLIMEQYLGRPLTRYDAVHHINKNRLDNRLENLQLMTISQHSTLHNTGKKHPASEQTRQRISQGLKKAYASEEARKRKSIAMTKIWASEEHRQRVSKTMKRIRAERFWSSRKVNFHELAS